MGLFDDFDVDMDEVKEAGGFSFDDGFYEFEIVEALRQNGTQNRPDDTKLIIKFDLDEAGTYWDWYTIAVDGDSEHPDAKRSLGYLKTTLLALGFKLSELNDIDYEDLEGIRGTFELKTTKNKKTNKEYQNIRNLKVTDEEPEPEPEPAPKRRAAAKSTTKDDDAAAKQRVAARRAEREAAEDAPEEAPAPRRRRVTKEEDAPAPRTRGRGRAVADDEDDENPFG